MKLSKLFKAAALSALVSLFGTTASADPLPGQQLKFQQLPLNNGLFPSTGGQLYYGHSEQSTAGLLPNGDYQGIFAADDFADNFNTPVVHVKWWGSYQNNLTGNNGVQKFLISFETDVPQSTVAPINPFSHPGTPLLTQIVTPGALTPGSGTFTETFLNTAPGENLYQYNAELAFPFNQVKDTVYWLKIVALVDQANDGPIKWGWHNRDWGIQDPLASPAITPGESIIGTVVNSSGTPDPVWHFQDDGVSGRIDVFSNAAFPPQPSILQTNYAPYNYIYNTPGVVGIDGPFGIQNYSQDMAFELYTTPVPEPSTIAFAGLCGAGIFVAYRRKLAAKKKLAAENAQITV